jgi:nitroreductase
MELGEAIRRRRMVRNFEDRPVPAEALDRILDHARRAPSAGHTQGFAFLVLEEPEQVGRFWDCTFPLERRGDFRWAGLFRAPVVILPCASKEAYLDRYAEPDKGWTDRDEARWPVPYWDVDAGMAALLMLLTAVDEGLGACFFGVPADRVGALRETFGVPAAYRPVGVVSVGFPGGDDRRSPSLRRGRRGVGEVVHRGRW